MNYPIEKDETIETIRSAINMKNTEVSKNRRANDFYIISDPIYNKAHLSLLIKSIDQKNTRVFFEHFATSSFIPYIMNYDYTAMKSQIIIGMFITFFSAVFFIGCIFMTFGFMKYQGLDIVPIICLFFVSGMIILFILNAVRLYIICKVLNGDFVIDEKFLTLLILRHCYHYEELNEKNEVLRLIGE